MQHVSTQNPLEVKKKLSLYSVVQSNTEFATQLYQAVREKEENVLVSPLSVGAALSMVWLGAAGETAAQIQKALHLPADQDKVAEGYHELFHTLEDTGKDNVTLALATKMYVHDIFLLRENFQSLVVQSFYSEVEKVDFMKKSEEIRVSINKWVENKTHDKIKDLMPEGVVNMDTRVVMVNAVYFKGLWKIPFEAEFTRDLPFHLANGSIVNVSTMVASGEFPITQVPHLNCTLLSLPYQGSTSLLVLFPEKPDALPVLEKHFSLLDLENITSKLENIDMHLLFPKFTMEFSSELEEPLRSLGINAMFDSEADFSSISPIKGLSVNHVIHKTFLKITEEGSEASASTAIDLDIRGGTFSLNVNHPFLFVIRDDKTGSVLFLGNYQGPK